MNITFRKQNYLERFLDWALIPFMYLIAGTFKERPQQTHKWNIRRLNGENLLKLKPEGKIIIEAGIPDAMEKHRGILFHFPIFTGWNHYRVISPNNPEKGLHIGWGSEVSSLPLYEPVRMLIGRGGTEFFGISFDGEQIPVKITGNGKIGDKSSFSGLPLF